MKRNVTMQDVADSAGVSKASVSNLFNYPDRLRAEVRTRIEEAVHRLGYAGPDPKARLLNSGKVNMIGWVPSGDYGICSAFVIHSTLLLHGVAEVCDENGCGLSLISGMGEARSAGISNALVDGFILGNLDDVNFLEIGKRRSLPMVLLDQTGDDSVGSVSVDDQDGARIMTQHLLDLGHRRFAVMTHTRLDDGRPEVFHPGAGRHRALLPALPSLPKRLQGVADALKSAGLSIDDMPLVEGNGRMGPGWTGGTVDAAKSVLDNAPEATAIIALTDGFALAILTEAKQRGISIPDDLSVVGFGNLPLAALAEPPLSSISHDAEEKGRIAARMLFDSAPPRQVILPVELVVRSSTAPPRT
ncbi:MAG: LacI family DNA-binding transcriptional regulator [Paracoccaceae bacterium]